MNRRWFLKFFTAAPAVAMLPALPKIAKASPFPKGLLAEAAERAVNPPLIYDGSLVKGELSLRPGGVTWVDIEYDEQLGQVLR